MIQAFILFYIICAVLTMRHFGHQKEVLAISAVVLTALVGSRSGWPDELVYQMAFDRAPAPWEAYSVTPFGYVEHGYLFLASCIKLVFNNNRIYLFAMAGLSMYLLYKNLDKYSALPLIGLCDYIGRFLLNRDCQQMRSSLAILMIILAIKLVQEKKMWQFFLVIFVAYQFHHMSLIALPFYFIGRMKLNNGIIISGLLVAIVLSQLISGAISGVVENYSEDLQYTTYTEGKYVDEALGLANPMIWFQIGILLLYSFMEDRLKDLSPYYYLFRTGYFYSTLILIFFCNYTALSGRTSTMFATLEAFILPLICLGFKNKTIRVGYLAMIGIVFIYFFMSKYNAAMDMMNGGEVLMRVK